MNWNHRGRLALLLGQWHETTRQTALGLAEQGTRLLFVSPEADEARRIARQINRAGGDAHAIEAGLEEWSEAAMRSLAAVTPRGCIDILCLSPAPQRVLPGGRGAGQLGQTPLVIPDIHSVVSPLLACLPQMIQNGYGRIIVNVADRAQWGEDVENPAVSLIENQLATFIGLLASAVSRHDVAINVVAPSSTPHPAETIAQAICYLAYEREGGLTGHVINAFAVDATCASVSSGGRAAPFSDHQMLPLHVICHMAMRDFERRVN